MKSVVYIDDLEQWREGFSFYIPVNIRFSETDMFGHVNNVSPFIYFEEARIEYLKSVGLFLQSNENNESNENVGIPIVADLQCDYHQQIFFNEQLKLYVKVNYIGNTSLDIHYMALNEHEIICLTGRGRIVYVNPNSGKPIPLSDQMKTKLRQS